MIYKNCPPILESYLRYLEFVENMSPNTLNSKLTDIRGLLQFIQAKSLPEVSDLKLSGVCVTDMSAAAVAAVTQDDIESYIEYLSKDAHISATSIQCRKLVSLRRFYDYLIRHQEDLGIFIPFNPVMDGKPGIVAERPARALLPGEVRRLLKAIEGQNALRDTAIVLLILTTGIPVSQLVRVRCEDYREDTLLVAGRKVYLTETCQEALNAYIQEVRDPGVHDNAIFVSDNYYRRLTPRGVQKALQKHFDRAGIQATAKDLQHTAVVELLKTARNDCERAYIAGYLGYTSLDSLRKLTPIQPADPAAAPVNMVEKTWLAELGADNA